MIEIGVPMLAIMIVWLGLVVVVASQTARSSGGSVGLPMAYLFVTTFMFGGAFIYVVPGYTHFHDTGSLYLQHYDFTESTVLYGTLASLAGMAGFSIGCWLVKSPIARTNWRTGGLMVIDHMYRRRLIIALGVFGAAAFVLNAININVPLMQAFIQVGRNAAVVFVCLGAAMAVLADGSRTYTKWLVGAAAIPALYLIVWGFVSYGFVVFTIFAGFWLGVLAPKRLRGIQIGIAAIVLTYVLLSTFVAYMSFRDELREILWSDAGFSDRISSIWLAFSRTELLNPYNFESLDWLNIRLNQSIFVGKAIEWHELHPYLRQYGATLILALVAWVPRILWPGKPAMGGSQFVAEHTGMRFDESTTFGAGPIFEFYVNFGYWGVFFGCIVLGLIIRFIDVRASMALRQGRQFDFARWFTVGIAFIAPLTDFFFMINTAFMSWVVFSAMGVWLGREINVSAMGARVQAGRPAPPGWGGR